MFSDEGQSRRGHVIERLLSIMARLRAPEGGCPWDVEQTFETIAPYTIEEAYEVADAIDRADMSDLRDELGDLLLQVVFHARMAQEAGHFDFSGVVASICDKMVARHPCFGEAKIDRPTNRRQTGKPQGRRTPNSNSHEIDVALGLPALMRTAKIGKRAAGMGFDWPDSTGVLQNRGRAAELKEAADVDQAAQNESRKRSATFCLLRPTWHVTTRLIRRRRYGARPKISTRFKAMEARVVDSGVSLKATLHELETAWLAAKRRLTS